MFVKDPEKSHKKSETVAEKRPKIFKPSQQIPKDP